MSCRNFSCAKVIVIILATVSSGLYGQAGQDRLVIKTDDVKILEDYLIGWQLDLKPLVSYPHPSPGVKARFGEYWVVRVDKEDIVFLSREIKQLPGVRQVENDETNFIEVFAGGESGSHPLPDTFYDPYTPNDLLYYQQWEKPVTQTDWGWNSTRGDRDVVIAVIDTGVDSDHEDLVNNLTGGYNTIEDNDNWEDDFGHGTHTSGIAAAEIDNLLGIAGTAGKCSILPLKAADENGTYTNSDLTEAILYAVDNGADVINMSLGGTGNAVLNSAVQYAWEQGVFLCASAGNDNAEFSDDPAAYPHVMSVGATAYGDIRWRLSQWLGSNYGESVDVYAPGKMIYSTYFNGDYEPRDGTSMASPQVAGLAALIWSAYPQYTNQEVWDVVISTADTVELDVGDALRINVRRALDVVGICEELQISFEVRADKIQQGIVELSCSLPSSSYYSLKLFDVTGREVYRHRGETDDRGTISLSLELAPAVYIWRLEHETIIASGKFVYLQ